MFGMAAQERTLGIMRLICMKQTPVVYSIAV